MIKEFALEPEAIATWESFRYFIEKFGVSRGRVISRFPKQWKRLVYEAAQKALGGTKQLSLIEIRLNSLGNDVLFPTGRPGGDAAQPWLARALAEHAREPFDGIIACANPDRHPQILLHADVDEEDARFRASPQIEVERTAIKLVGCAGFLLRYATTVKWVDHVMDLRQPRWQRPFRAALNVLVAERRPVLFEIHRRFGNEIEKANQCRWFQDALERHRTPGITFALHLHAEAEMHDRFILTERGGLQIGHGLDDNEDGESVPNANVTLLERTMFETQWNKFSSETSRVLRLTP